MAFQKIFLKKVCILVKSWKYDINVIYLPLRIANIRFKTKPRGVAHVIILYQHFAVLGILFCNFTFLAYNNVLDLKLNLCINSSLVGGLFIRLTLKIWNTYKNAHTMWQSSSIFHQHFAITWKKICNFFKRSYKAIFDLKLKLCKYFHQYNTMLKYSCPVPDFLLIACPLLWGLLNTEAVGDIIFFSVQ